MLPPGRTLPSFEFLVAPGVPWLVASSFCLCVHCHMAIFPLSLHVSSGLSLVQFSHSVMSDSL